MAAVLCLTATCRREAFDPAGFSHSLELARHAGDAVPAVETRSVDFGTPEAHDHFVSGWSGDEVFADDGSTFTWSLGAGAVLKLRVLEPRDLRLTMRLRPYRIDGPPQRVDFALNGTEVGSLSLKGGRRVYDLDLPAAALLRGRNLLRVTNVYPPNPPPGPPDLGPPGTAWDYLVVGEAEPGEPAAPGAPRALRAAAGRRFAVRRRPGDPRPPGCGLLDLDGHRAESYVDPPWKLLCEDRAGIACRLFDLDADPRERHDLSEERPVLAGYLGQRLRKACRPVGPGLTAARAEVDDRLRDRLRALGYMQ